MHQLLKKEAEMRQMRERLAQAERLVEARKVELAEQTAREAAEVAQARAREAARELQRRQFEEQQGLLKRKARLANGFGAAAQGAKSGQQAGGADGGAVGGSTGSTLQAAQAQQPRAAAVAADAAEVQRVLSARSDHDCLKLVAGASLGEVRRAYKALAVALHPDKCKLEGALAAFQRVSAAHANLNKFV